MTISINQGLNINLIDTSVQDTTIKKQATSNEAEEALTLQSLQDEIAKLPKSNNKRVQIVREKILSGALGIFAKKEESAKAYLIIADKITTTDQLFQNVALKIYTGTPND